MITSFLDAATDYVTLVPETADGQPHGPAQVPDVGAADVSQLHPLQVVPDALVGVQIGGVTGQWLQADTLGAAAGQEVLDGLALMDGGTIPDNHQLARDMPKQMLQEVHHIRAALGPLLSHQQEGPLHGDAADGRHVVSGQRDSQDGSLTAGGIGAYQTGQEVKTTLVYPDDSSTFFLGPLFMAGHCSVYHLLMASSSRWVARRIGFWTLQPISFRSLQI